MSKIEYIERLECDNCSKIIDKNKLEFEKSECKWNKQIFEKHDWGVYHWEWHYKDYIELPDGRRGKVCGLYKYNSHSVGTDVIGLDINLDKEFTNGKQWERINVWFYHGMPESRIDPNTIKIIREKGKWLAPWTPEEVKEIKDYADYFERAIKDPDINAGNSHRLKCPNPIHRKEDLSIIDMDIPCLVIYSDELHCYTNDPKCRYSQNWVEDWIVNGSWRDMMKYHNKEKESQDKFRPKWRKAILTKVFAKGSKYELPIGGLLWIKNKESEMIRANIGALVMDEMIIHEAPRYESNIICTSRKLDGVYTPSIKTVKLLDEYSDDIQLIELEDWLEQERKRLGGLNVPEY